LNAENQLFSNKYRQVPHVALKADAAIPITVTIAGIRRPRGFSDRKF
jgi:hypothetical protein